MALTLQEQETVINYNRSKPLKVNLSDEEKNRRAERLAQMRANIDSE